MARQKFISVKEAAEHLGIDERSVRERLMNGTLKGEKKSVGLKEKWFVNTASVDAAAGKLRAFEPGSLEEPELKHAVDDMDTIDVEHAETTEEASSTDWLEEERQRMKTLAETMMTPLLQTIREQERELQQKDRQLKLLPDLQKQAEQHAQERDILHVENEALKKQCAAIKAEMGEEKTILNQELETLQQTCKQLEIDLKSAKKSWIQKLFGGA